MEPYAFSLVVVGFFLVLGALLLPRFLQRANRAKKRVLPQTVSFVPTPEEERELNKARELLIHVDDFSRQAFAKLDTKLRLLNRLIEEADVKIRRLESQIAARRAETPDA